MRLDVFLVQQGFAESREKAKTLIKEGKVLVNGEIKINPSKSVDDEDKIKLTGSFDYVGRGGYKLENVVKYFGINLKDKIIADVGCSTGGFTDYVIKHGAKKVYAIDIGDDLHPDLKRNKKIIYLPKRDVRDIQSLDDKIDVCLIDVTFLSLKDVLPTVKNLLDNSGEVIALVKPPFETEKVKKIKTIEQCKEIAENLCKWSNKNGYICEGLYESPIKGKMSKQSEFFLYLIKR